MKIRNSTQFSNKEIKFRQLKLDVLAFLIVFLAIWIPKSLELNRFATPDEHLWLARSAGFASALKHRDFGSTFQIYHPGVTVMWTGALSFLSRIPEYMGTVGWQLWPDHFYGYLTNLRMIDVLATA